jgi:hypothetical protein
MPYQRNLISSRKVLPSQHSEGNVTTSAIDRLLKAMWHFGVTCVQKVKWLPYTAPALTLRNVCFLPTECIRVLCMILTINRIISLNSTNRLFAVTEIYCVFCELENEFGGIT